MSGKTSTTSTESSFLFRSRKTAPVDKSPGKTDSSDDFDSEKSVAAATADESFLFGMVLFKNKADPTVKRGAVQRSMLILGYEPIFNVWEPFMRMGLRRIMDMGEQPDRLLKTMYLTLSDSELLSKDMNVTIWDEKIPIKFPKLERDQFANVSLLELVRKFGEEIMLIWHGLMLEKRILFVGAPAKAVANCCLACPLLVHPIQGFTSKITPYVALTDLSPIFQDKPNVSRKRSFIAGSTNMLFETKTGLYTTPLWKLRLLTCMRAILPSDEVFGLVFSWPRLV